MRKIVVLLSIIGVLFASSTPYSLDKFKKVLKVVKFQAPFSHYDSKWSAKYGKFENFSNRYFYLQDDRYMAFYMCEKSKEKRRSELRFKEDWLVGDRSLKILKLRVKLFVMSQKREFTFAQIHSDGTIKNQPTINLPLLRVVWFKKYRSVKNHIWAIVRLNPKEKIYKKVDLGVLPKGFFNLKIKVQNSIMSVEANGKTYSQDVSYWGRYPSYFKVGVYLQDIGCAKVLVDELSFESL